MRALTIGQVAKRAGVGVETVRFYEREGLLEEPDRKDSGYRQYGQEVIARLCFIRKAKELGFTLKEIKELLSIRLDPTTTCADVRERAEAKIVDIENRISTLERLRQALVRVTGSCQGNGPTNQCPILDSLGHQEDEPECS